MDQFLKHHMKILSDFNAKVGTEGISNQQPRMRVYKKLIMIMR
jgi:hypothetical protein